MDMMINYAHDIFLNTNNEKVCMCAIFSKLNNEVVCVCPFITLEKRQKFISALLNVLFWYPLHPRIVITLAI
jgi:hypothetical protein